MVKYFHNLTGIAIIAMTENVNFQILFNIYFQCSIVLKCVCLMLQEDNHIQKINEDYILFVYLTHINWFPRILKMYLYFLVIL